MRLCIQIMAASKTHAVHIDSVWARHREGEPVDVFHADPTPEDPRHFQGAYPGDNPPLKNVYIFDWPHDLAKAKQTFINDFDEGIARTRYVFEDATNGQSFRMHQLGVALKQRKKGMRDTYEAEARLPDGSPFSAAARR